MAIGDSSRVRLIAHRRGERIPPAVGWLTGLGAIPFALGAAAVWLAPGAGWAWPGPVLSVYAAVILSFLGGIAWGSACASAADEPWSSEPGQILAASVVPSLVGWAAVFLPPRYSLLALAASFAAVLLLDRWLADAGMVPAWWMKLRIRVSAGVVVLLLAAAAGS